MKRHYFIALLALVVATISCSMTTEKGENANQTQTNVQDNRVKVLLKTTMGDITVALYNETPQHRDNFIKLVNEHYYDSLLFHRVIKDFMIQGGDGNSKNAKPDAPLGAGDPGYTLPAEIVYPKYFHKRGALAAARTGDQVNPERRSSGSQFYIVTGRVYSQEDMAGMEQQMQNMAKQGIFMQLAGGHRAEIMKMQAERDTAGMMRLQEELIEQVENVYKQDPVSITPEQRQAYTTVGGAPHLDNQYTVFGEVIDGYDIVDMIQRVEVGRNDRPTSDVRILKAEVIK